MKNISAILILFTLFISACETASTKTSGPSESSLVIDTVLIDPGDQLVFPYLIAERSFFTENSRYLFNFNDFDHTLEKIDLDKLELTEKHPFDK
ncbi:DUF4221 family protein [Lunatibacter salilacus]|uniref:DUF4221 family protein n=1 Tax=Lunatibacter salilacus TaxID=2483804 RepID=UPI00131D3ABF|nr:DUF4221 family protein [Lunatibacter salilacus]